MKTEIKLNIAQRNEMARIFKSMLREEKFWEVWGPQIKAFYEQYIDWYFIPFKGNELPPIQCNQRELSDKDRNITDIIYKFTIELTFNTIKDMNRSIVMEQEMSKSSIDMIV